LTRLDRFFWTTLRHLWAANGQTCCSS
jgi:hypothetical protein